MAAVSWVLIASYFARQSGSEGWAATVIGSEAQPTAKKKRQVLASNFMLVPTVPSATSQDRTLPELRQSVSKIVMENALSDQIAAQSDRRVL